MKEKDQRFVRMKYTLLYIFYQISAFFYSIDIFLFSKLNFLFSFWKLINQHAYNKNERLYNQNIPLITISAIMSFVFFTCARQVYNILRKPPGYAIYIILGLVAKLSKPV